MSGDWPPEWEDLEEFPEGADQLDAEAGGRLSDVTAYLASLPAPVLPAAVEARISAALAAEATARAGASERDDVPSPDEDAASGAAEPADGARTLEPAPARARVRRHRSVSAGHRASRSRRLMAVGSVIACLALAGLGYGLSRGGGPSGMSSASSAAGSAAQSNAASAPVPAASPSSAAAAPYSGDVAAGLHFAVTASGTRYQAATLAAQARANVAAAPEPGAAKPTPTPDSNANARTGTPTAGLRGCVAQLTGGRSPQLVDLATYQGKPAYIIVGSAKVWVVGLGCTAGNPELIASVPLGP